MSAFVIDKYVMCGTVFTVAPLTYRSPHAATTVLQASLPKHLMPCSEVHANHA